MKNSLLYITLAAVSSAVCLNAAVEDAVKKVEDFVVMEKRHTNNWLKFKQAEVDAKFKLKEAKAKACADLMVKRLNDLKKNNGCVDEAAVDAWAREMVEIHETFVTKMRNLCLKHENEAKKLDLKHSTELAEFKTKHAIVTSRAV